MTTQQIVTPRIYVACLAAYNNGRLHGEWLDLEDIDTLQDGINSMLKASPCKDAEEWEIHDIEGLPSCADGFGLEKLVELAEFIKEHGELGQALLDHTCGDLEYAVRLMENHHGEFKDEGDFAYSLVQDCYDLKSMGHLANYIDYDQYARDLFMEGYISIDLNGDCHVFSE